MPKNPMIPRIDMKIDTRTEFFGPMPASIQRPT